MLVRLDIDLYHQQVKAVEKVVVVRFGTYNIRNGRSVGLDLALRGMSQTNVDLSLMQEINCTYKLYMRESTDFCFVTPDTQICYRGGMSLFFKELQRFAVEAHQQHGTKVIILQLVMVC